MREDAGASANRRQPGDRSQQSTRNLDQLGQQAGILEQRPFVFDHVATLMAVGKQAHVGAINFECVAVSYVKP